MRVISRTLLLVLGFFWISTCGEKADVPEEGCVIVANHLGTAEIMWLMYEYGTAFVAKSDYKTLPIAGKVAECLDFIFVDQQSSTGASGAIQAYFAAGSPNRRRLCIFPEGTTTNGSGIITFRSGAFLPQVQVLPHAICFNFCRGSQVDPHFSVGKLPQQIGLMFNVWNNMSVEYLPPVAPDAMPQPRGRAELVRKSIADALGVPLVDCSYDDKVAYEVSIGIRKASDLKKGVGDESCRVVEDIESDSRRDSLE